MSGTDAARRTLRAEAADAERVKLAERWIKLPGNEALTLHAVNGEGAWYAKPLANGMKSHGLMPWADLKRALEVPS